MTGSAFLFDASARLSHRSEPSSVAAKQALMSALGHKQTWRSQNAMFASPRKRTPLLALWMSAKGQKRTHAPQHDATVKYVTDLPVGEWYDAP
jgi:hypothetical protein